LEALIEERTKKIQEEQATAEKAMLEAEKQREIAERANILKTELLNIVAHDLKSPLITVKMMSKIILDQVDKDSALANYAADIFSTAQRMHNLVNEILESATIENGLLSLNKKPVDISQLAELVVMDNRISAQQKEQKIIFTPSEAILVSADDERLREVMDNLINNAIKYSDLRKGIWVTVSKLDDIARFEVRDEGPGLTEEDNRKVFGKFQKLSAQPTAGEPSAGLGLSIVKQLIEMHGGKVWVKSEFGKGSTFVIELPIIK
jgi:signal transduction histidine kinase